MSEEDRDAFYDDNSYLDDEPTSSRQDQVSDNNTPGSQSVLNPQTPPFELDNDSKDSYVSAVEQAEEVSTSPLDYEGRGGDVVSCMSTIEEESKTYETSTAPSVSRIHNRVDQEQDVLASSQEVRDDFQSSQSHVQKRRSIDEELEELRRFVDSATIRSDPTSPITPCDAGQLKLPGDPLPTSSQENANISNVSDHDVGALLEKLQKLESTQNILEKILNSGVPENLDIDTIISQLPLDDPISFVKCRNAGDGEDQSERSVSSEIASIQKLIDGVDLSPSFISEVAGGNQLDKAVNEEQTSTKKERDIDDVLKEYEEFERSLSQASGVDDSFRSDIGSLKSFSTRSNKPIVPEDLPSSSSFVPVIKPPLLKTTVPPSTTVSSNPPPANIESRQCPDMFAPPLIRSQSPGSSSNQPSARTRPMTSSSHVTKKSSTANDASKSSRIEHSQSVHLMKTQSTSQSARTTSSSTAASPKNNNQNAFKPRNRRMVSPRKSSHQNQPPTFSAGDMPMNSSTGGAGEGYQVNQQHGSNQVIDDTNNVIAAEALKTIEKLNTMVARQETLLEAYSKDNDRLWGQLRDAKAASNEKEAEFQDVISSLKTEVATMKLNQLVSTPPRQRPSFVNREELQKLKEDSELKSQQVLDLRREILVLQSKLSGMTKSSPTKQKQSQSQNAAVNLIVQEKEKEYQKQITALNKQVRTLQKILYSKDQTAPTAQPSNSNTSQNPKLSQTNKTRPLMQRAQSSDTGFKSGNANVQNLIKGSKGTGVDPSGMIQKRPASSPIKGLNMNTGDILQASLDCIEQERADFENRIAEKDKVIFEKETMIINLKHQVESLKRELPDENEIVDPGLIDELRSRIITQNRVIQQLKEHLSTFKKLEAENIYLREEKSVLEDQVIELRRKLEFAQSLRKPENEVLCLLSEKVDELNSRYYHRERQLDSLLNRLTLKTTTSAPGGGVGGILSTTSSSGSSSNGSAGITRPLLLSSPRRRIALDQFNNNNGSLGKTRSGTSSSAIIPTDILHMVDFSPSASFQLDVQDL